MFWWDEAPASGGDPIDPFGTLGFFGLCMALLLLPLLVMA